MEGKPADQKAETPILVSIEETALCLGVTPATIRSWILKKKIGSNKLGGRRLIPKSEIARMIKETYQPATQSFA